MDIESLPSFVLSHVLDTCGICRIHRGHCYRVKSFTNGRQYIAKNKRPDGTIVRTRGWCREWPQMRKLSMAGDAIHFPSPTVVSKSLPSPVPPAQQSWSAPSFRLLPSPRSVHPVQPVPSTHCTSVVVFTFGRPTSRSTAGERERRLAKGRGTNASSHVERTCHCVEHRS